MNVLYEGFEGCNATKYIGLRVGESYGSGDEEKPAGRINGYMRRDSPLNYASVLRSRLRLE